MTKANTISNYLLIYTNYPGKSNDISSALSYIRIDAAIQ